jgi:hypothetical protein
MTNLLDPIARRALLALAACCALAAPAFANKPCPAGQHWVNTCPPGAECITGGHCVKAGSAHTSACPKGQHWVDTCPPGAECIVGGHCEAEKGPAKKCPAGESLQQVKCIRAPCPAICMPDKGSKSAKGKKCPPGQEPKQVECIRAPCPAICQPVGG